VDLYSPYLFTFFPITFHTFIHLKKTYQVDIILNPILIAMAYTCFSKKLKKIVIISDNIFLFPSSDVFYNVVQTIEKMDKYFW